MSTLAKLLSLANEEDETEQEAAVVLVEARSEKVLDTVDEEPTRLSPGKLSVIFLTCIFLTISLN